MDIKLTTLLAVLLFTLVVVAAGVRLVRSAADRMMLLALGSGLLVYSGIGAAYPEVPSKYPVYYAGSLLVLVLGYVLFSYLLGPVGRALRMHLDQLASGIDQNPIWPLLIVFYILLSLFPLVYPEFRLDEIFAPAAPRVFTRSRGGDLFYMQGVFGLTHQLQLLLKPFFYIGLFRYRRHLGVVVAILLSTVYIEYIIWGYVSRSAILKVLVLIGLVIWLIRPRLRPALVLTSAAGIPLLLIGAYVYGEVRRGRPLEAVEPGTAIVSVLHRETSFPRTVGSRLLESGARTDLGEYFMWILTIPIPDSLLEREVGARINTEISEIYLGIPRYHDRFYGVMSGFAAESVYVFGPTFFWIHAVFVAALAAFAARTFGGSRSLLFLYCYVVIMFGYNLNRGGISSLLPPFVNEFLGLWFVVITLSGFRQISGRWRTVPRPAANRT